MEPQRVLPGVRLAPALLLALACTGCTSASSEPPDKRQQMIEERLEEELQEAASRLELTEAQQQAMRPILRECIEKRMNILDRHLGKMRRLRSRRELRTQLMQLNRETQHRLAALLDPGQMEEYRRIVKERRERAMEEYRSREEG